MFGLGTGNWKSIPPTCGKKEKEFNNTFFCLPKHGACQGVGLRAFKIVSKTITSCFRRQRL